MALRNLVLFLGLGLVSAHFDVSMFEKAMQKARRLDSHEGGDAAKMQKCMEACPDIAKMAEMANDFGEMCKVIDCMMKDDNCGSMVEQINTGGMMDCLCHKDVTPTMTAIMGASADPKVGVCKDAATKKGEDGDDEVDPCAMTGECKKVAGAGIKVIQEDEKCKGMKESMDKDMTADEKKCMDDLISSADVAAADDAQKAALPAMGMLGLFALLRF